MRQMIGGRIEAERGGVPVSLSLSTRGLLSVVLDRRDSSEIMNHDLSIKYYPKHKGVHARTHRPAVSECRREFIAMNTFAGVGIVQTENSKEINSVM